MTDVSNKKIFWNQQDLPDDFTLLMRNLGPKQKLDIKTMYQDQQPIVTTNQKKPKWEKGSGKGKRVKSVSKKDQIIQENLAKKKAKQVESDLQKLESFVAETENDFERWLGYIKTDEIRVKLKLAAIQKALVTNNGNTLVELILQVPEPPECAVLKAKTDKKIAKEAKKSKKSSHKKTETKVFDVDSALAWTNHEVSTYLKAKRMVAAISTADYQLEKLGNRLAPLDFYNYAGFKLDPWQMEVIDKLNAQESVLVCAPTSSGKTVLSTYFATVGKKVMYVVPSKPLAFQVAALFHQILGDGVAVFVEDFSYIPSTGIQIAIGTPYQLETQLPKLGDFEVAVFDEIHNLNRHEGDSYERIIKWHTGNFLALSATIQNPSTLLNWWRLIKPSLTISVVEYEHRFINIQRHVWDPTTSKINNLNPLSCLEVSDFKNGTAGTSFTPLDTMSVWEQIEERFGVDSSSSESDSESETDKASSTHKQAPRVPEIDVSYLEPTTFFKSNPRIALNDVRDYEQAQKKFLATLPEEQLTEILADSYLDDGKTSEAEVDLVEFIFDLRRKKLLPAITFNIQSGACRNMFRTLIKSLEDHEQSCYPYHYPDLEFRAKLYKSYQQRREKLQTDTSEKELEQIMMAFEKKELAAYQKTITDNYVRNCDRAKQRLKRPEGRKKVIGSDGFVGDWTQQHIDNVTANLRKEYNDLISANQIENTDLFEKHAEYCVNATPMKANQIRQIRKTIIKKTGLKIDYTNPLIQGLKRGIGLYVQDLPDVYLQIVQELAQNRELGIVISDESLALGINMPFRTAVIMGWQGYNDFGSLLFQQMAGRAGRRGYDSEGHVVFANVPWKSMMKSQLESITGKTDLPACYGVLSKSYPQYDDTRVNSLTSQFLNPTLANASNLLTVDKGDNLTYPLEIELLQLIWKLRKYGNSTISFINQIDLVEMTLKNNDKTKSANRKSYYGFLLILSTVVDPNTSGSTEAVTLLDCLDKTEDTIQRLSGLSQTVMRVLTDNTILTSTEHEVKYQLVKIILSVGEIAKICYNSLRGLHFSQIATKLMYHCFETCHRLAFEANDFTTD